MNPTSQDIGASIRKIRKKKRLTLAKLADQCGCSSSLLSQMETGAVNPSFSTLRNISDALGVSMASLLSVNAAGTEQSYALMHQKQRKSLKTQGGVTFQLLTRGMDFPCEFILNQWPPGSSTGINLYTHEGKECGLLLEGELDVDIGKETLRIKPGDTITFHSEVPHKISNPGRKKAVAVWINTSPMVFAIK
ncbi:helix-turn-helix domain-containing protein [Thermodesulfobacteriota bacterium]